MSIFSNHDSESQDHEIGVLRSENQLLRQRLSIAKQEMSDVRDDMDDIIADRNSLYRKSEELEAKLAASEARNAVLERDAMEFRATISQMQSRIDKLSRELSMVAGERAADTPQVMSPNGETHMRPVHHAFDVPGLEAAMKFKQRQLRTFS